MKGRRRETLSHAGACKQQTLLQPRSKTWLDVTGPLWPQNFCFLQLQTKKAGPLAAVHGCVLGITSKAPFCSGFSSLPAICLAAAARGALPLHGQLWCTHSPFNLVLEAITTA